MASADFLQNLVAKVADPLASDIDARIKAAAEIREFLDTPRESDSFHALGPLIPPILTLLRSHPIVHDRTAKDFLFRRALVEIINHLPFHEQVRPHAGPIFDCMIHVVRMDNEENGVSCCKTLIDLIRNYRATSPQNITDFFALFRDSCGNMPAMVIAVLSPTSTPVDPEAVLPCLRSFKGMVEMGAVMASFMQLQRAGTPPEILKPAFEVISLQSPAQQAARENHEAMGQFWAGMSPDIQNAMAYSDFLAAQVKILSYLTYVMRWGVENQDTYGDTLLLSTLRLLQDCPANAVGTRKELIVVFRHLLGNVHRRAIFPQIDKLFQQHVLLGTGVTGREMFRSPIYSALADFFHQTRNELSLTQLTHVVLVYTRLMHNPAIQTSVHPMCAKIIISLIDTIVAKDKSPPTKTLLYILDTCLDRLDAMNIALEEAYASLERAKNNNKAEIHDAAFIEKARPLGGAASAMEEPEDVVHQSRNLCKTLMHGFRSCLSALKKGGEVVVDGSRMNRLFVAAVRAMSLFEPNNEDPTEWFALVLIELNLHVFQEIWTLNMDFFFQSAQKRPQILALCQVILLKDPFSPTLLAILLRYLVDRLPLLGEYDEPIAGATIRLFKMAFNSVPTHQSTNEAILASHLPKLLMDCFPLAAKATKPAHYLFLLRSLFRAIGGGGGRFELLYKEVLPLLPEMLESLNVQLLASEGQTRDLIVELCLTVPLRLTHLLPHLTYLMQPLALALRGPQELVAQGLRTLELCIDNLTPDFLDPTLSTVLRELMEALHSHLKPLPASHQLAHTIIRILGKLGGRNRKLLTLEPALKFHDRSEAAKVPISFAGNAEKIDIGPMVTLACRVLRKGHARDRLHAYNYLENCLSTMLNDGVVGRNMEATFVSTLEGLFDALNLPEPSELPDRAEEYLLKLSRSVVDMEVRRGQQARPSPLLNVLLDALPYALSRERVEQAEKAQSLLDPAPVPDIMMILHHITNRFTSLCLDDAWERKRAGYKGIRIMTVTPSLGTKWVTDREPDLVRILIRILKDLPTGLTRDADEVVDTLLSVLRISNAGLDFSESSNQPLHNKLISLTGLFCSELQSPNSVVRQASQTCIALLVQISGRTAYGLLEQHRDRLLSGIYTKPLRALPFLIQIGMIEAVRYCITLDPPLVEYNEELLRLLHETLALADAEDSSLLSRGTSVRQGTMEIIKLRVACIKLLTASMPLTDFFSRQHQTRQRVTGVYFKSLYSPSPEVKDVAYDGLKMVLTHQSRLPRELLQTGLRPILMNLADPKRLSVPGLEGLARLLELLTNYFKVEIGHKLLDHFRIVADPLLLSSASKSLGENEGITKLVRLANIFHLLPSAANIFLEPLVNQIVQTESQMHFSGQTPFSEPLAKYLNRYPAEGVDFFLRQLAFSSHLRTLRSILQAKLAPHLQRELASRSSALVALLRGDDPSQILPSLYLISDLVELSPSWISENGYVIDALLEIWHSETPQLESSAEVLPQVIERHNVLLSIFKAVLKSSPRIDLLFEIVIVYTRNLGMDLLRTTRFLYEHVALSDNVLLQRNVLMRFLAWFDDSSVPWAQKMFFIRYVVTPTVLIQAHRPETRDQLLDTGFINRLSRLIWHPTPDPSADDLFKIELLHLSTVLVHQYPKLLDDAKKDIIRCAWQYISNEDTIVKQTGFLLTARFFVAFPSPPRFVLKTWHGLLRTPSAEGRPLVRSEALATLVPCLSGSDTTDARYPQWAWTARNLLVEEGLSQSLTIYQLVVKHSALFYPVRGLFVSHMINSLSKLGMSTSSTPDSRALSIDILSVIFKWEEQTTEAVAAGTGGGGESWVTPLTFRENLVSYLVRLATYVDPVARNNIQAPRSLVLLQKMVGPNGWRDVAFGLRFFQKQLEQALASAKVLQVIAAEQDDNWYTANAEMLQRLVRKGMITDEYVLHDALHPIFTQLIRLFPLPKEDDEQPDEHADFHSFVHTSIFDGLRDTKALRGILLMLKSVVQVSPERIEPYSGHLMRLLGKLAKEHVNSALAAPGFDNSVRLIITILDICQLSVAWLADQRRWLLSTLVVLVEKSKSSQICTYTLDLAKSWALVKQDTYPTMKEKASLLQKMVAFESRAETIYHSYLEVIYQIYTEPHLRRSDLTSRLEQSFLLGCRAKDPELREKFMDLLDLSVPRSLASRLTYIFGVQSWEALADHNWMYLALHLVLNASDATGVPSQHVPAPFDRRASAVPIPRPTTQSILQPMQRLLFLDSQVAHDTWVSVFPAAWASLSRREQIDITQHMINLLSRDYHIKQSDLRPNVIQTLLTGIHACSPSMTLPPHLVKYLGKTFGAWYVALEILGTSLEQIKDDEHTVREYVFDSLADVYAELAEDDMFYGLWRHRCLHLDTNIALAFEQNGMWEQASNAYEVAQGKARAGTIPFSESEFCLWEDHWILAAEKLQQWDILSDLAKSEGNQELGLECAWRTTQWVDARDALEDQISQLPEVPTPRRRVFEAFIALLKLPGAVDKNMEFTKILEDAMQLSLRKWVAFPPNFSAAHVPLLQHFQQFVELQEAVQIFGSLSTTNAQNLEKKSSDLKMVLQAWRERLPNLQDDISIWSDLVAWRQNVFHAINGTYIPLIANNNQGAANNSQTFGYRGYHETAWIINRFAHVARKHDLLDACFTSLTKIYTLPNIEISEAFLKLREQARCHYQKPNDLQAGLEVINNTNLVFFSVAQKAEFYTLKGMFHARFKRNEEANLAFGQAVQLDMTQAKAWAEWGRFNDNMFKEVPNDLSYAANAVSCYLQAAGQYKSAKSRPLIARIQWLLSVDDNTLAIARAFDTYKGDAAYWYWISSIPHLCMSMYGREVKQARYVLLSLARHYPQALFFQLRTTREEVMQRKAAMARAQAASADPSRLPDGSAAPTAPAAAAAADHPMPAATDDPHTPRTAPAAAPAWDYVEEVVQLLKTAFPLLVLSLETIVDQVAAKFKSSSEEDTYRHLCMLLSDALQNYVLRTNSPTDDGQVNQQTMATLGRFGMTLNGQVKKDFDEAFGPKQTVYEYIQKLQQWRSRYEKNIDAKPRTQPLDTLSHYLSEFQYMKVDEIEVPGQYTEDKDSNQNFIRIQKFGPKFENCRTHGFTWKRIVIHGTDNSKTTFSIQVNITRNSRREERVMQIFRTFNGSLMRKPQSRKRNLSFHIPAVVSFSPNLRLLQTDSSYVSLGDVYDLHCEENGFAKEDPVLFVGEKTKKVLREYFQQTGSQPGKSEYLTLKKDLYDEVALKMVPEDILTKYMIRTMEGPSELWRMRKQFALQVASCSFMTYMLSLTHRTPQRYIFSRTTGQMTMTEMVPGIAQHLPVFATNDVVPFRLTPNIQNFLGRIVTEGILTSGIMAIGRSLTEPEFDLEQQLCLFSRDEVMNWIRARPGNAGSNDPNFRKFVAANIDSIVKRAETMACKVEREQAVQNPTAPVMAPVVQTVTNLISSATNPIQLTKMGEMYTPWF
ncbi:FAT domain-containing protein [Roridomyces roridus]|uniref:FAT domain-containing protein n=1 Tax=Roridomyces roridus TaxID=1738132 RepID=A0AAD7FV19_9AGAR|nr:FAT domain-containing protein [Roridomyces roridus]